MSKFNIEEAVVTKIINYPEPMKRPLAFDTSESARKTRSFAWVLFDNKPLIRKIIEENGLLKTKISEFEKKQKKDEKTIQSLIKKVNQLKGLNNGE